MIKFIDNNKVILNQRDYNSISGVYKAFNHNLGYCAELLDYGNRNHFNLMDYLDRPSATISPDVKRDNYKNVFIEVFKNNNYEIIEDGEDEGYYYEKYLKKQYEEYRKSEDK